jgi:hypothetical protein
LPITADAPGTKFCVAHLITHSTNFENIKVSPDLFDPATTTISLTDSYVTRDKFLVNTNDINMANNYGHFDLNKLSNSLEY